MTNKQTDRRTKLIFFSGSKQDPAFGREKIKIDRKKKQYVPVGEIVGEILGIPVGKLVVGFNVELIGHRVKSHWPYV